MLGYVREGTPRVLAQGRKERPARRTPALGSTDIPW